MTCKKTRICSLLSELQLFDELGGNDLGRIAQSITEIELGRREFVFQRGGSCSGFHIVVAGQIKLFFVSPQRSEKVVRIVAAGQSFGEESMFLEKSYILSARALTEAVVLHIPKDAVFALVASNHHFARKMLVDLSHRLRDLMTDIETYSLKSGSQRVADYLLQGSDHAHEGQHRLESSKSVIASRLSLTPEHFSRILHGLCANRVIRVKGRLVEVLNVEGLRQYQGGAPLWRKTRDMNGLR